MAIDWAFGSGSGGGGGSWAPGGSIRRQRPGWGRSRWGRPGMTQAGSAQPYAPRAIPRGDLGGSSGYASAPPSRAGLTGGTPYGLSTELPGPSSGYGAPASAPAPGVPPGGGNVYGAPAPAPVPGAPPTSGYGVPAPVPAAAPAPGAPPSGTLSFVDTPPDPRQVQMHKWLDTLDPVMQGMVRGSVERQGRSWPAVVDEHNRFLQRWG